MSAAVTSSASNAPTRPFGKTGERVSAIGYGAMGLAAFYGKPKTQEECNAGAQYRRVLPILSKLTSN